MASSYVGRFAPSPSGPLHFGSLIAALASFIDARYHGGQWLLRIDDIDTPRCVAGMDTYIQTSLRKLGLQWDGQTRYQSQRLEEYTAALSRLDDADLVYPCYCSRKMTAGRAYPGTCRSVKPAPSKQHCLRIQTTADTIALHDVIQGTLTRRLTTTSGDFIVQRADKIVAYNLAVVIDDHLNNMTHIVRGADLIETCFSQLHLHTLMGITPPVYAHHPVIANLAGAKYSKQHGALDVMRLAAPNELIYHALRFLGQQPPRDLFAQSKGKIIDWAIMNWDRHKIPQQQQVRLADPL